MNDRVPSDHPSITTVRATIQRRGRTSQPELLIPQSARDLFPAGDLIRLVIDSAHYYVQLEQSHDGHPVIRGAFENRRLARTTGEGTNHLPRWMEDASLTFGRSVLLDIVVPEFLYGLRLPGQSTVYDVIHPPSDSLHSIAEQLSDDY